jgi:hypothetical protein
MKENNKMKAKIVWSGEVGDYKVEVGRGKEFLYVEIYNLYNRHNY